MPADIEHPTDTAGAAAAAAAAAASEKGAPNDQGGAKSDSGTSLLGDEGAAPKGEQGGEPNGQETADEFASLKLPEGAEVDEKFFTGVKAWAKESGIKADALQKLVTSWGDRVKEISAESEKQATAEREKLVQGWVKGLKEDKVFGGQKYDENVSAVRTFLNGMDPDRSFRKEIVKAGIDNWPPLVRFLHSLAVKSKDDSIAGTLEGQPRTPANDDKAFEKELYPSMFKGA